MVFYSYKQLDFGICPKPNVPKVLNSMKILEARCVSVLMQTDKEAFVQLCLLASAVVSLLTVYSTFVWQPELSRFLPTYFPGTETGAACKMCILFCFSVFVGPNVYEVQKLSISESFFFKKSSLSEFVFLIFVLMIVYCGQKSTCQCILLYPFCAKILWQVWSIKYS